MSESATATTKDAGPEAPAASGGGGGFMSGPVGRNLGLVVALAILCIVGVITAGDRFADVDNVLTILRLASVIGVVSIGMTFVIIGGGIDLSVGALVALASVWATTLATQQIAEDFHWIVMVVTAIAGGRRRRSGQRRGHRLRQARRVHRHARDAGRGPRPGRDHRQPAHPDRPGPRTSWTSSPATSSASRRW